MKHLPLSAPLLVYDADCNFCRRWITRWKKLTGERVAYLPFQEVADYFPEIPRSAFAASVQWIEPGGQNCSGADAVFRVLDQALPKRKILYLRHLPGFLPLARWAYRFIARHRSFFSHFS